MTPSTSPAPRILVCGWAGAGNVGDELLTAAIVALVRAAGGVAVVASRDPAATTARHGVESVPWGFAAVRPAASVDGACVGPGGIIQDSSSLWSLPGHLAGPARVGRRGGPVVGIGLGAEVLRLPGSARMVRRVLGTGPVLCRDQASVDALARAGVEAAVAADLAFTLDPPPVAPADELVVAIGPEVGPGLLRPASRRLETGDLDLIAAALDAQAGRLSVPVVFVCFRGDRDRAMADGLARRLRAPATVVAGDVDEQVARVAGARAVITSRYHALVVAARSGTPAVVVSRQAKLASLVEQVGAVVLHHGREWAEVGAIDLAVGRRTPAIPPLGESAAVIADLVRRAAAAPTRPLAD